MIRYNNNNKFEARENKNVNQCVDLIMETIEEMFGENENYQDILQELEKRLNDKSKFENMYEEEKESVARTEAFKYLREQLLNSLDDFDFM
jgi:hypothetical protein